MSDQEKKVFDQEVSKDELSSVSGGASTYKCTHYERRSRTYEGCAATVENGSTCWENDACVMGQVIYDEALDMMLARRED